MTEVRIEPVNELPRRLRPSPHDPVVDEIAKLEPGSGWHRIATTDPGGLRIRLAARKVKVSARRYPSDPDALFVKVG